MLKIDKNMTDGVEVASFELEHITSMEVNFADPLVYKINLELTFYHGDNLDEVNKIVENLRNR